MKCRVTSVLLITLLSTGCPDDKPKPMADSGVPPNPELLIEPDPSTLTIMEGGPGVTFTVKLTEDPERSIGVQMTSSDSAAISIEPANGALDSDNFATGIVVTLTGVEDDNATNEMVQISIDSGVGNKTYTVMVGDNDASNLMVTPAAVSMAENGTATIQVQLSAAPADQVIIAVGSGDTARLNVDPATLTFDATNFDSPQTVTLSALDDVDVLENVVDLTLDHPVNADVTVVVTIQDDDAQSYVVSTSSITIDEAGSGTFTINLSAQPTNDVTVTIASNQPGTATAAPAQLTFTAQDWDQPQTITVWGVDDPNVSTDTATITAVSPDVPGAASVLVGVTDDDTQIIEVSTSSIAVFENGTASFGVRLVFPPAGDVDVTVTPSDPAKVGVSTFSLTFTPNDYDTFQLVTVSGIDDADAANSTAAIALSALDAGLVTVRVDITDDDVIAVQTDLASVTVDEGASQNLGVRLSMQPTGDVVVTAASAGGSFTVNPVSLTFTPANWDTLQVVSIEGAQDQDVADESDSIELTSPGVSRASVPVTVVDDDLQAIVVSNAAVTVPENGASTFDVTLAYEPAGDVTIDLTAADTFIGANPASITFTPANWNMPRAITVSAIDDVNTVDEQSSILLSSAPLADVTVTVMVEDDDAQAIVLGANQLAITENGMGMFTVRLAFQPATPRTLSIQSSDAGAATALPATLSFDATNWDVPQPVMVNGVNDVDVSNETVTITVSGTNLTDATVAVTVTDDDTQVLVLSRTTLALDEGASGTVNVSLMYQPAGNVTVAVSSNNTSVMAVPVMLTFTPGTYDAPQPVTISGLQDQDLEDESAVVTVSSAGLAGATVAVTVNDDDTQALVVSPTTLTVNEGASGNISVRLAFQPAANVTVTITSGDVNAATPSPAALTFTAANYATNQTVAITGVQDADVQDETLNVTVASGGIASVLVAVTVVDNDVLNLAVNPTSLALTEGGAAGTFGVMLTQQPAANVTVNLAASPAGELTLGAATLTFTAANWNVAQSVTVTPNADNDALDENVTITLTAVGLTPRTVTVTIADDDTQAIVLSANTLALTEGANGTVTVRLAYDPVTPATVTITSGDAGAVGRAPASLTFTTANYATPQTVTLSALADADTRNETVNVTFTSAIAATQTVAVTVTDDDVQALVLSRTTVAVNEGATQLVGISLAFNPVNPVTVTAASSDAGAATAAPATFTFTSANYATPQNLTIAGVQDNDTANENVTIAVQTAVAPSRTIAVSVTDDDTQSITISRTTIAIGEGGTATFTAQLAFDPITPVTVTIASSNTAVATVAPLTMTFNDTNWSVPQTATVMAPQDDDTRNDSATITLSSPVTVNRTIAVSVTDDDTQAIVVSANSLVVAEDVSGAFTVRLAYNPLASVTVSIANSDAGAATVSPATLTFTAANYTTPQTVTVTGINDNDPLDENLTLTLSGGGAPQNVTVAVTVNDDDVQAMILSTNTITVAEGATSTALTVRLAFNPVTNAVVSLASTDAGAATATPVSLTFTAANYATPQTVTITGVQDLDVVDESVNINLTTAIAPAMQVAVAVTDDDTQAIVVSANAVTVTEGLTTTFSVNLAFQPAADTTITVASADPSAATVSPTTLVFTPVNWNVARPVTVTGVPDQDQLDDSTMVAVTSPGLANQIIAVNVTDDDDQAIIVSANTLAIDEEATGTFTVRLAYIPLNPIEMVAVISNDNGAATALPVLLAFDAANYATPQTVTVTGETDEDILDETVTITLDSDAPATPNQTVTVNVNDIDIQEIRFSEGTVTLDEGAPAVTVTVWLAQDPSGNQTVTVASQDTGAVSATPASLVFNSGNYTVPQPVTITTLQDDDVRDEDVEVRYSSPNVTDRMTRVIVNDDDTQAILATPLALSVVEGASNTFTVRLEFRPTNPVTVTVTNSDPTIATHAPASLVFDSTNFDVLQTVTVDGTQDNDLEDEASTFTLSDGALAPPEGSADVSIDLTVTEDDQQVIIVESVPSTLPTSVQEDGPGVPFTVRLGFLPRLAQGGTDVVEISDAGGLLTFTPSTITFGQTDYDQPVQVTVTATDDGDDLNDQITTDLVIVGEVSTTFPIQLIDDEIPVLDSTTYTGLTGGTLFTKRQNILWGSTRLGVVGFDTATGGTRIASNTRELDDPVVGAQIATGGGGALSAESIEFDGTNFRWFVSSSGGIDYAGSDETASTAFLTQNVAGTAALNFWPAFNGTNAFGLVYRENGATSDRLLFQTVQLNGTASAPLTLTLADGSDDLQPNAHFNGAGYTVIYTSGPEVRCVRTNANGVLVPSSDVVLGGFPAGGAFVSTVRDGTSLVAAYYNATNSINVVRINAGNCTVSGAHSPVGGSNVFLSSPPSIAWNGDDLAVAYDYLDNNVETVAVLLVTPALTARSDFVVGPGSRPSITWAGDRWALRHGSPVVVTVGSFQAPSP